MLTHHYLIGLLFPFLLCTCAPPPHTFNGEMPKQAPEPTLTNLPTERLAEIRTAYRNGDGVTAEIIEKLVKRADEELDGPIYTITNKKVMPPSGKANDYLSIGPYWWPDPEKEDGLPWIRRDGEVNPITQGELADKSQKNKFFNALMALAYANYFTGENRYATRAETLTNAWFVDPATRMNPHLDYAQGIPGINTGRCFGIIEMTDVIDGVTSLELLERSAVVSPAVLAGGRKWMSDYLNWLQTSELGIEEGSRFNNHGTWYDVQVMTLLLYLDRKDEARAVAEAARQRIDSQIEPDGAQPHELARTKTLSYSTMNLKAFTELAYLAQAVDVDLWSYRSPTGGSLAQAYEFLRPYANGREEWTRPQIGGPEKELPRLRELFAMAGTLFDEAAYCAVVPGRELSDVEDLFYNCR